MVWLFFYYHTVLASRVRARVQYNTVLNLIGKNHRKTVVFLYTVLPLFGGGYAVYSTVLPIDLNFEREQSHERKRVRFWELVRQCARNSDRLCRGVEENVADCDVDKRVEGEGVGVRIVIEGSAVNDCGIDNESGRVFAVDTDNERVEPDRDFFCGELSEVLVFERDTRECMRSARRLIGVDF